MNSYTQLYSIWIYYKYWAESIYDTESNMLRLLLLLLVPLRVEVLERARLITNSIVVLVLLVILILGMVSVTVLTLPVLVSIVGLLIRELSLR